MSFGCDKTRVDKQLTREEILQKFPPAEYHAAFVARLFPDVDPTLKRLPPGVPEPLAELLGVEQTTITRLRKDRMPDVYEVLLLALSRGVHPSWLAYGDTPMDATEAEILKLLRAVKATHSKGVENVLNNARFVAGLPAETPPLPSQLSSLLDAGLDALEALKVLTPRLRNAALTNRAAKEVARLAMRIDMLLNPVSVKTTPVSSTVRTRLATGGRGKSSKAPALPATRRGQTLQGQGSNP